MPFQIVDSKPPTSDAELDAVEVRLNIKLPDDYRRFLLRHNGGRPEPKGFSFQHGGSSNDSAVAWFLAVHQGPYENFENDYAMFKVRERRMPENLVPIARDPFGNRICMSFAGDDKGWIYFWDHEEERGKPSYRNCYLIAKGLDEFLGGLHEVVAE